MGIPLSVVCCFSLDAFNIWSLSLIFISLINMCLGVFHLGFILFVTLWVSWELGDYFLPHFREVFNYYLLKYFLMTFRSVFFWDSYDSNAGAFNIVPEVSEVVLISFNSFFLSASNILSSTSLILPFASVILLLALSRMF